jgi:GNAT superfamily N-acetyltransferase
VPLPPPRGAGPPIRYRRARASDLDTCAQVSKVAIDDYLLRLNQPQQPEDVSHLRRLLAHLHETDPDRFWVATRGTSGPAEERLVGFSSASVRGDLWFLAMLFVDPADQADGVGKALMDHAQAARDVDPGGPLVPGPDDPLDSGIRIWGMCTDSAQPISNALYASRGMVPRVPVWRLSGEVRRWAALPEPPAGTEAIPFETVEARTSDGPERLAAHLAELDRELLGITHPVDHVYLRREGRVGVLLREPRGRVLGYAYASSVGRMGPVAAVDPALHPALIGMALRETPVAGPVGTWIPGTADVALRALLGAGLRLETFPALICWSRPTHPFERYLPISLAII